MLFRVVPYTMRLPRQQADSERLVTYTIGSEESVPAAIAEAFRAIDHDLEEKDTVVVDWVHGDAIDRLCRTSGRHLHVSTLVWGHPVVITPEEVRVYAERDDRQ